MAALADAATMAEAGAPAREFERWMASEQRRIYLLCLRMLRNSDDADTATQDTFLKAYRAVERRDSPLPDSPEKWVTRIAVNTCLDLLRSRRWRFWQQRVSEASEEAILQLVPSRTPSPEKALGTRDLARRLTSAVNKLSPRQRSVFILRHEEDHSLEEIGELLGLDVGTVKAHMARALKKLREDLRDLYGTQTLDP